jgi:serine/threonine protein kinase
VRRPQPLPHIRNPPDLRLAADHDLHLVTDASTDHRATQRRDWGHRPEKAVASGNGQFHAGATRRQEECPAAFLILDFDNGPERDARGGRKLRWVEGLERGQLRPPLSGSIVVPFGQPAVLESAPRILALLRGGRPFARLDRRFLSSRLRLARGCPQLFAELRHEMTLVHVKTVSPCANRATFCLVAGVPSLIPREWRDLRTQLASLDDSPRLPSATGGRWLYVAVLPFSPEVDSRIGAAAGWTLRLGPAKMVSDLVNVDLRSWYVNPKPSGQYVGRYRLLKKIASGGMGEIFLAATDGPEGFQKAVILKRILSSVATDEAYVRLFLDEARLVAKLSHRNIAQIHELGQDDEGYYVVMEFVKGPSVRRLLATMASRGQRVPAALAVDIAAQVADALAYAYSATNDDGLALKIVHRDVTPENILVSVSGDVKLIDFGVAKSTTQRHSTEVGAIKGKMAYMSPEQSEGKPLDGRSDIFSLGIVLAEMLSGSNPFDRGHDIMRTVMAIQKSEPRLPSADDPSLAPIDDVLGRMLRKNPEDRIPDANHLFDELNALRHRLASPPRRLGPFVEEYFGDEIANLIKSVSDPEAQKAMLASAGLANSRTPPSQSPPTRDAAAVMASAGGRYPESAPTSIRADLTATNPYPGRVGLANAPTRLGSVQTKPEAEVRLPPAPASTEEAVRALRPNRMIPVAAIAGTLVLTAIGAVLVFRSGSTEELPPLEPVKVGTPMAVPSPPAPAPSDSKTESVPAPDTVKIWLMSDPANADVYSADVWLGRTPVMIDWKNGQREELKFTLDGYAPQTRVIEPHAEAPIFVRLTKISSHPKRKAAPAPEQLEDVKGNPFK